MSDLRLAMGIGRQSLYNSFGDKKQLFHEAFERYRGKAVARLRELLSHTNALVGIRAYLLEFATNLADDVDRAGCLIFNTCPETTSTKSDIDDLGRSGVDDVRRALEATLHRAHESGELTTNVESLALSLTATTAGMVVLSRGGYSKEQLLSVAELAHAQLS